MQTIEIDWEIHQKIEAARRGFDEPPYVALRRLLGLSELEPAPTQPVQEAITAGSPWIEQGVKVPHGSAARMEYDRRNQVYEGQFLNGQLVVNGQAFKTLSAAASALAATKDGAHPNLNGWNYWSAKFPGETKWRLLRDMRNDISTACSPARHHAQPRRCSNSKRENHSHGNRF